MILDNIPRDATPTNEEFFGPVFSLWKFGDDSEAVEIANSSTFGLGGAVIGTDLERAEKVALQLESGMAYVNKPTSSVAHLPYGGVKNSGYGRECRDGIREFTNIKSVVIKKK
jgi:succinate-semialdehyde dehydrogenase/glutarate-semialdehyde dehydrogenase